MRRRRFVVLVSVLSCLGALVGAAVSSAGASARRPPSVQRVSLLYVVNASSGTLVPSGTGQLTLSLRVDPRAVWFSDRPARRSGTLPSSALATSWRGFGFAADPPNAALDYGSTVILRLSAPRYENGWLRFAARRIEPKTVAGNLATHARAVDRKPPRRFGPAALFVDDTTAPVINGCVLQPWAFCPRADLQSSNLGRLDLTGADFQGANLSRSSFAGATLTSAVFGTATVCEADFVGAALANATFVGADISYSDLMNATGFNGAGVANEGMTTLPDGSVTPWSEGQCG